MTPAEISTAPNWSFRADEAARSVTRLFGQRLFFLPGTHIAAIVRPSGRVKNLARPWHYWWQAHYVDCLVDTGRRELGTEGRPGTRFDGENRPSAGRLASQLVAGIRLRNFLTFVNNYYDDMAWLALSTLRLEKLAEDSRKAAGRRRNAKALQSLTLQFDSASTDDLGGGTFWSKKRDFKNTPATAPVALYYARTGKAAKAQALLDWLDARLFDPEQGMYQDGLRIAPGGDVVLESAIYTYNQGPVLGALLELGGDSQPGPRLRARGRRGPEPHPPGAADGAQRHGAALRGNRRRRAVHRHPRPVPGAGRRRRAASRRGPDHGRDPGQRHRRGVLGGPPHRVGRRSRWRARAAGSCSPPAPNCRRGAATRRAPPSSFPPSCRPGWCWKPPPRLPAGSVPRTPQRPGQRTRELEAPAEGAGRAGPGGGADAVTGRRKNHAQNPPPGN